MNSPHPLSLLAVFILCLGLGLSAPAEAQDGEQQLRGQKYQMLRTKHRAEQGYTNKGRVFYHYVSDADVGDPKSAEIGNVTVRPERDIVELENGNFIVGSKSGVRKIDSAVSLRRSYKFTEQATVGTVTVVAPDSRVDDVKTNVHLSKGITVR